MLVSTQHRKLILNLRDHERILNLIPSAKGFQYKGRTLVAIPHAIDEVRSEYVSQGASIGSVPPPATVKGAAGAVRDLAKLFDWRRYHTWTSIHSPAGFPDEILLRDHCGSPATLTP